MSSATSQDSSFDLSGKVAFVSGASRGIGEQIARRFAQHGARVVVSSRKIERCEVVAASIRQSGGTATARACHLGDLAQIESTLNSVYAEFGRLDILVNNAAANPYLGHVVETTPEAFQKTVDVNIRGYFFSTAYAAKLMNCNGGGSIINIASISGIVPGPQQGIYSISKAAILSMTKVFAAECAPMGVRVNAIIPGITDTRFSSALVSNTEVLAQYMPHVALGRVADPIEMAGAALYFASSASSYTTGASLVVDGGYLVK